MAHHHDHNHQAVNFSSLNKAFIIGISLNILFVLAELGAGLWIDSVALLSDAGHNLSDVFSLVLAMVAFRLTKVKANQHYTYGYKKSTVLVSLLNAIILLVAVGAILLESINKLRNPTPVDGYTIAWVAGIGVLINGITAYLFNKDKKKDLNIKGAYLHMLADALVSVGVLISGIVMNLTGFYIIDPLISIAVVVVILVSTWRLLHDSVRLSLDGVPVDIDMNEVCKIIRETPGVQGVHHLHIWALSTTEIALTAHIVSNDIERMEEMKQIIKDKLKDIGIGHATLEFEKAGRHCEMLTPAGGNTCYYSND